MVVSVEGEEEEEPEQEEEEEEDIVSFLHHTLIICSPFYITPSCLHTSVSRRIRVAC